MSSLVGIDLESKTVPELKEMADERNIEYTSNILKADLIEKLEE